MSTRTALWAYTVAIAVLAMLGYPLLVGEYGPLSRHDLGAGLILLCSAPVAESLVVHVHFRKSAHSFSLLELPLVAGMMTTHPLMVVLAYSLGGGTVLLVRRRQPPLKFVFNTATFLLTAIVGVAVFRGIPHPGAVGEPATWGAAAAATLVASSLGTTLVFGIISTAERSLRVRNLGTALLWGLATAIGAGSLGIACAMLASVSPAAVVFVTAPLFAVFAANRAYEAERERRENLEVVFDTSRTLTEEPESEHALFGALVRCYQAMPADFVAIYLSHGNLGVLRLMVDAYGHHRTIESRESVAPLFEIASRRGRAWVAGDALDESESQDTGRSPTGSLGILSALMGRTDLQEALIGPLVGGPETLGIVVVANSGGSFRHLDHDQLGLFETVCNGIGSHTRLTREAYSDSLTSLPNRRRLLQRLEALYEQDAADEVAFILIDLDDFKGINDTFGHAIGDRVLGVVADRLQDVAPDGWMVARLGGDEFAMLGEDAAATWQFAANAALNAFVAPIKAANQDFQVRLSMGAAFGAQAESPAALLRNADTAMYEAKRLGKGQIAAFNEPMHERAARRYRIAEALRSAIDNDEIRIAFQPIVDISTGAIVGGEALARWHHAEYGHVPPNEFVHIAEEEGLSSRLAARVLARVSQELSVFPGRLSITMNVSPGDLGDGLFVNALLEAAEEARPHRLGIEVTERMLLSDVAIRDGLGALKEGGVGIYIDDFGTGYSSLAYLKDVPADYLKVPCEFVREIETGARALAVVNAVVAIGRALGIKVIAEGVETLGQERMLVGAGVFFAQGYLYDRPLAASEFRERLDQRPTALVA